VAAIGAILETSINRRDSMAVRYVGVEEAMAHDGLRMAVVGGIPSPWGEAAKGILHIKRIEWAAVRLAYDDERLKNWIGQLSAPVAMYGDEPARSGWADILLLAERLAPAPSLLPLDPAERALVFGLAHELCGEGGLAWTRRLQLVHGGMREEGGFPIRVAKYLGKKYGYRADDGAGYAARVVALLGMFAARLEAQQAAGSRYLVGTALTAADIYCAACMALFKPLPHEHCAMDPATRSVFEYLDAATSAALDPILLAHRDWMYAQHLELPLSL
jgi:glutathione S-transferase